MRLKEETGKRYGRLTVSHLDPITHKGERHWICICDCGKTASVRGTSLRRKLTRSCGCLMEEARQNFVKEGIIHHQSHDGLYGIWAGMIRRCEDSNREEYQRYGARGIEICPRWRDSFEAFASDMGPRPSELYSIDRIDNEKGYFPQNCRWATQTEQANNRRDNIRINVFGETMTLTQAVKKYGTVSRKCLESRLRYGWNPEKALTVPVRVKHPSVPQTQT